MANAKVAFVTGITGQDGSYLTELLLRKGYVVHGLKRRTSSFNTGRIDHLYQDPHVAERTLFLHHGDMTDTSSLVRIIERARPSEIYNLAAQSHVAVSFEEPEYTAESDAIGTLRLLEAVRILKAEKSVRFYQASTSELFGKVREVPQRETTPFHPRSPYAVAKLYSYWAVINYREAYGMHASNGILFNHESPRRGETFVTRKITRGLARIKAGLEDCVYLGNMSARRDWGHAKDFCEAMHAMLQQDAPDDYVIATGKQYSVREFVQATANALDMKIRFEGEGLDEIGVTDEGKVIVRVDPAYFRPAEVESLLGDATKAKEALGWTPTTSFDQLVREMAVADYADAQLETELRGRYSEEHESINTRIRSRPPGFGGQRHPQDA